MNGFTYKIIPEFKLVIEKGNGEIRQADFIEMLGGLYQMDEYVGTTRVLTDFRGVELIYSMNDIDAIASFIRNSSNNPNMVYHVVLTDVPSLTAVSMLFQEASKDIPDYSCMVCSTESGAANFLGIDEGLLSDTLCSLKR